jgi:acetyl-CoA acyltransferase 2
MSNQALPREVWVVAAKRTPFGALNGALKSLTATELGVAAAKAALEQSGVPASEFQQVFAGNVQQTSRDAAYLARHVGLLAGLPVAAPALTVNRLCGSGFQAIISGATEICMGDAHVVMCVGTESMTQAPHVVRGLRDGLRLGTEPVMEDSLWAGLTDSYCKLPMGMTAENVGLKLEVTRRDADEFALLSQQRWERAQREGRFQDELAPVTLSTRKGSHVVDRDEHPRPATTLDALEALPPVFKKDGLVTAGNASGICDGAGALVLVDADYGRAHGLKPLARVKQWATAGVEPEYMGLGPVPAIRGVLQRAGLGLKDIDLLDVNEAFAAQWIGVERELGFDRERANVNGGAIALGHPLGASGARIAANLIYQLRRDRKTLGIGAACIGGGQGIAVLLESTGGPPS